MAELKTKLNDASVDEFLQTVKDEGTRADCYQIPDMMQKATKAQPKMWGTRVLKKLITNSAKRMKQMSAWSG